MIYNLADDRDRERFKRRVNHLYEKKALVEVKDATGRTRNQYNYLHLSFQIFAAEMGEKFEYVKQVYFKRECCPDIFIVRIFDRVLDHETERVLSINDIKDVETISKCIDEWVRWCAGKGVIIPPPDDEENLRKAASAVSMAEKYM